MHYRMPIPEDRSEFTPLKLEHFNLGIIVVVHWDLRRRCSYVESSDVVNNAAQPDYYQVGQHLFLFSYDAALLCDCACCNSVILFPDGVLVCSDSHFVAG